MNPVDDARFTRPLIKALIGHVDAFAASMPGPKQLREKHHRAAVAWVYTSTLVAWAEDHGLIDPFLRADAKPAREVFADAGGDMQAWLAGSFSSLAVHPTTRCLIDPRWTPLADGMPSEEACRALVAWWTDDAPPLAFEVDAGPASISGWLPGDLLQSLSDERRKGHALCQTPWWVADFILDRTLLPAADEFRDETIMTIDPTCGTGHFLIRKIEYLWELYTTGSLAARQTKGQAPVAGWAPVAPAEAIRRILAGVTGIELDPLTTAVARLRTLVALGDLMRRGGLIDRLRLDVIPAGIRPRVAVADSLLAGKIPTAEYFKLRPEHAAIYGWQPDAPAAQHQQLDLFGDAA